MVALHHLDLPNSKRIELYARSPDGNRRKQNIQF